MLYGLKSDSHECGLLKLSKCVLLPESYKLTFMLDVGMGYVSLDPYTLFDYFLACRPYIPSHF